MVSFDPSKLEDKPTDMKFEKLFFRFSHKNNENTINEIYVYIEENIKDTHAEK